MVRELFDLARTKAPSIIFIDEIDAIGSKRLDVATSGDREVQRTLMQLLAELDVVFVELCIQRGIATNATRPAAIHDLGKVHEMKRAPRACPHIQLGKAEIHGISSRIDCRLQ